MSNKYRYKLHNQGDGSIINIETFLEVKVGHLIEIQRDMKKAGEISEYVVLSVEGNIIEAETRTKVYAFEHKEF